MPFYKFKPNDLFYNRVKVNPKQTFLFYLNTVRVLNNLVNESGSHAAHVPNMLSSGYVSLYELNVDRSTNQLIHPFVVKTSDRTSFKTVTTSSFNADYEFGATISSIYPLSASVSKLLLNAVPVTWDPLVDGGYRNRIQALKNTLNFHSKLSPAYQYSSSVGNKQIQRLGLLSIPSILYGSSIKKGSIDLKFYVSGTLVGQLQDSRRNGELIQVGPPGSNYSGSIAGVALYNEGFLVLTGSWDLAAAGTPYGSTATPFTENYGGVTVPDSPRWAYFAQNISGTIVALSSSFEMSYEGLDYVPTITMLAHAPRGELNHSNNPTYPEYNLNRIFFSSGSTGYGEPTNTAIKNIVSSSFIAPTASFEKETYISQIGVYDEDKKLIAVAKLATPVKKTQERDYTFKLKLDI